MFQQPMTKAKLQDVVVLSRKNRQPDENPGAKLVVSWSMLPGDLVQFDGSLRTFLFERDATKAKQGTLEGIEDTGQLTRAGSSLGTLVWKQDMTGYTLIIGWGTGRNDINLSDCQLTQWRLTPKDGAVLVKVNIDAPDVGTDVFGRLAKLKSCEIDLTLNPPAEPAQKDLVTPSTKPAKQPAVIDGTKGHPGAAAAAANEGKPKDAGWPFGDKGDQNAPATDATSGAGAADAGGDAPTGEGAASAAVGGRRGRGRSSLAVVE